MSRYYSRTGEPITIQELIAIDRDNRVALDKLPNGYRVSTIWLGLDHQYSDGPPLIFETMVFPQDSWSEEECKRYSTEEQALAGHAAMVEKWRAMPPAEVSK